MKQKNINILYWIAMAGLLAWFSYSKGWIDPTKVDRSGAYAARHVAKNLVASGACERATIQVAYAIGVAKPVSIYVDTHNTNVVDEAKIVACVEELFDLTPRGIIESLDRSY